MTEKSRGTLVSSIRSLLGLFDQPNPAYVLGIDTSHWTGAVNWQMAWDAGIRFAIIKFMDGKTRTNYAEQNYRGAKDVGMMVGPYQWLRKAIEVSPGGQAREYAAMIADHPADIRPAVDYEWSPAGTAYNVDSGDLYGFVLPFADAYGKRPMIYSAYGYIMQYPLPAIYANDPFWQARYGGPPLSVPPWGLNWKFHQWTASGEGVKYGVDPNFEKSVDLNYWCGTLDELYDWCGKTVEPPPPPVVNTIVVKVQSDAQVKLQSVLLNGADETAHASIIISPITPPPPPPPPAPVVNPYRVLWMFQRPANLAPPVRFNKPDVLPGRKESRVALNSELQHYWYALLLKNRPAGWTDDQMKKAWKSLTAGDRAFTNFAGSEDHHDYINNTNVTAPDIAMDKFRVCGGGVVNVLSETPVNIIGIPCYRVQAIDPTSHPDPTKINHGQTPWLVHVATNDYELPEIHVGGFPQLGGNPVQVPLLGIGGENLLPVACLQKLDPNKPYPSPYLTV